MAGSPKPSDSVGVRAYPFSTDLPRNVFDRASEANHESNAICMSRQPVIDHLLQLPMPASPLPSQEIQTEKVCKGDSGHLPAI
jgi:hypothetical protein